MADPISLKLIKDIASDVSKHSQEIAVTKAETAGSRSGSLQEIDVPNRINGKEEDAISVHLAIAEKAGIKMKFKGTAMHSKDGIHIDNSVQVYVTDAAISTAKIKNQFSQAASEVKNMNKTELEEFSTRVSEIRSEIGKKAPEQKKELDQANTELTPEIRANLDAMFDGMKKVALSGITPELLRKRVKQIKDSNTDADKSKLSYDEAIKYLSTSIADPAVAPQMAEFIKNSKPQMEHNCATADSDFNKANNPVLQGALNIMGSQTLDNIKFSQDIASSGNDKALEAAVKRISGKLFTKVESQFGVLSQSSPESAQFLAEKMHGLFSDIAKETQSVLKKNPDIKRDLLELPNIDELGKLNANDACKAISGHGVGVMKM